MWTQVFSLYFLFYYYYYYHKSSTDAGAKEVKPSQLLCRIKYDLLKQIITNTYSIFKSTSLN